MTDDRTDSTKAPLADVRRGSRSAGSTSGASAPFLRRVLRQPRLPAALRRILVPIDFADGSRLAVREAASLAAEDTEVVLLHVIDPVFFGRGADAGHDFADRSIVNDCAHHLREIRDETLERRLGARMLVRQGPADSEILRAIQELQPDVTILAVAEPMDDLERDVPQSRTARSVLRRATGPVLLLRYAE